MLRSVASARLHCIPYLYIYIIIIGNNYVACYKLPMPKRAPRDGGENLRKLIIEVPEELLRILKIRAAEQDSTIREIVTRAIQRELEKDRGKSGKK